MNGDANDADIDFQRRVWLALNEQKRYTEAHQAYLTYMEASIGEIVQLPEMPTPSIDPDLPAHIRLIKLQEWQRRYHNKDAPVVEPLLLVPNRPVKDERGHPDPLYGLPFRTFTERQLATAMKADPLAVEEIFEHVKPFALVLQLDRVLDPAWTHAMPKVARDKVEKLCIAEMRQGDLTELQSCLRATNQLQNLRCVEFCIKPRLLSTVDDKVRKFSYEHAVTGGLKPGVRLFFRLVLADDTGVAPEERGERVQRVTEVVREVKLGGPRKARRRDVTEEYRHWTWETFDCAILRPYVPDRGWDVDDWV